jgi:hypothetical protein
LIYGCVHVLAQNPAGYLLLFEEMHPALLAALKETCEEMLAGTKEAYQAAIDGQSVEDWKAIRGGDGLALTPEQISSFKTDIAVLERFAEFLKAQ